MMKLLKIIILSIRILILDVEAILIEILLALFERIHKEDNLVNYIRMEGNYRIFKTTTGEFVVKHKDGSSVSFITKSESSAIDWCRRHG